MNLLSMFSILKTDYFQLSISTIDKHEEIIRVQIGSYLLELQ